MIDQWLGHYHSGHDSPIRRWPVEPKLGLGLVVILGTAFASPSWTWWFLGVSLLLAFSVWLSGIPVGFLAKRLAWLSPLIFSVAALNALQPSGRFPWWFTAAKSAICLLTVLLVSNTTPFSKILRALRRVYVPGLLITTIALMHRYLFVLAEEAERMRRARACRTFSQERRSHWRLLSGVIGQLFVRGSERAERIYVAMQARGWK